MEEDVGLAHHGRLHTLALPLQRDPGVLPIFWRSVEQGVREARDVLEGRLAGRRQLVRVLALHHRHLPWGRLRAVLSICTAIRQLLPFMGAADIKRRL